MRVVTECQTSSPESSQTNQIEIVVNGDPRKVPAGLNVATLLSWMEIDPSRVAVELNRAIVRQPEWLSTPVPGGSSLEIVQFVGGG